MENPKRKQGGNVKKVELESYYEGGMGYDYWE